MFWWAFSSCTLALNTLNSEQFLGSQGDRTLFHIHANSGCDIRRYSDFSAEAEVLLLPGIRLEVKAVLLQGLSFVFCVANLRLLKAR